MKLFVSLNEYTEKRSVTASIVIFTLKPDHRGRYKLNSNVNYEVRKELEKYSYFSISPEKVEDYEELMHNRKKAKRALKVKNYIPRHIQKTIDHLDGKKDFVYYQQFHFSTPESIFI